jgi:NSS family neurotransmitter:Na+ symporter
MEREQWSSRTSFLFAAIGSAIGLGNVWRFPYICYEYGGGAFLIPYFVALFTAGIPLMILEYGLGHLMTGSAPLSFSKIDKKCEWIGWLAVGTGFLITTYYAVIMSWCFCYLFYSAGLFWGDDARSFFFGNFLAVSDGPAEIGDVRLPILLGLVAVWVMIFLCIIKGARSVGKVVLVTVPLPWILLGILVIRGLTLPGAVDGIRFYLTPDFSVLKKPDVWLAAYSQIFFSLSLGFGILIAYASYLPKKSDVTNNAFITSLANCGTSFFAGFAVFSTLGYLAQSTGVGVRDVVASGPGLAFVTYPTVIKLLPFGASFFGVLFFLMLLVLAVDSAFSLVEAVVCAKMDKWGFSRAKGNFAVCATAFVVGILFTTKGGLYWLDIADHFLTNFGIVAVGLLQCIAVGWIFGTDRIREYINEQSEFSVGKWWDLLIKFVVPAILAILLIKTLIERVKIPYENYPQWALALGGWGLVALVIIASFFLATRRGRG